MQTSAIECKHPEFTADVTEHPWGDGCGVLVDAAVRCTTCGVHYYNARDARAGGVFHRADAARRAALDAWQREHAASWSPAVGDLVRRAAFVVPGEVGMITGKQPGPLPWVVTWPDGALFAYRASELVRDEHDACTGCGKRAVLARHEGGDAPWLCGDCERKAEAAKARACRTDVMLPCPFCRSTTLSVGAQPGAAFPVLDRPFVSCCACGARGPLARSAANREAIANWNRRPGLRDE